MLIESVYFTYQRTHINIGCSRFREFPRIQMTYRDRGKRAFCELQLQSKLFINSLSLSDLHRSFRVDAERKIVGEQGDELPDEKGDGDEYHEYPEHPAGTSIRHCVPDVDSAPHLSHRAFAMPMCGTPCVDVQHEKSVNTYFSPVQKTPIPAIPRHSDTLIVIRSVRNRPFPRVSPGFPKTYFCLFPRVLRVTESF